MYRFHLGWRVQRRGEDRKGGAGNRLLSNSSKASQSPASNSWGLLLKLSQSLAGEGMNMTSYSCCLFLAVAKTI